MRIILASTSPRRREILNRLHIKFEVFSPQVEEIRKKNEKVSNFVKRLAREKAKSVQKLTQDDALIIGADTIVYIDQMILGQPRNRNEAFEMLKILSGRTHKVYTGICLLYNEYEVTDYSKSYVTFHEMDNDEIEWYLKTNEFFDKAGSYGVQGYGSLFIKEIKGSYFNVMGFPVDLFYKLLRRIGISFKDLIKL